VQNYEIIFKTTYFYCKTFQNKAHFYEKWLQKGS